MTDTHDPAALEWLADRIERAATWHSDWRHEVADTLRTLSARIADLTRELDEARAGRAAALEEAAVQFDDVHLDYEGCVVVSMIRALIRPEEADALAERDARIRREAMKRILDRAWDVGVPESLYVDLEAEMHAATRGA